MDTGKDSDNDSFFLSDDEAEETPLRTSNQSIYDIDYSHADPNIIRIFNITPPIELNPQMNPDTIIPYYIIIYYPSPRKFESTETLNGAVKYADWLECLEAETVNVLVWWANQRDPKWLRRFPPTSFDSICNNYFPQPYTHAYPFTIYYFMSGEWQIVNYTSAQKDKIFSRFCLNLPSIYGY